ncbi:DUF4255 domain-containing protein [Aquimarina sp. BL5]|uniref:DUF4255 domain-containing protein n=1 Tax=Aquimarina sp. BL5 TaxID=1714860 RepID=UPI000E533D3D|nr:DUF4255 domain-containing protein [Aquimarina sp. BL5]AXT53597.1 DUF4255 domain-containing protein [Aquimarina sp. BL5]RKN03868.1 DUF4255 domain-containing protein [Aquimarina sp. BL5]
MIHSSLRFLTRTINDYLSMKNGLDENKIFLTHVSDESGVAIPDKSLGLSLVNIEEEKIFKEQNTAFINANGSVEYRNPELKLNLYVLISANYQNKDIDDPSDDYYEGLKQLSYVISLFQSKNVFTNDNTPAMASEDPNIKKLILELYSYSFEQMYNFWSVLGTKYLPSVLYKVRLLKIQEEELISDALPIEEIDLLSKTKEL